jgi:hypothetical protein
VTGAGSTPTASQACAGLAVALADGNQFVAFPEAYHRYRRPASTVFLVMDLTGGESQDWMGNGYVEAASTDGDDVDITGRAGTLPDDVDDILDDLLSEHDVARYPEGAVIGWFPTNDIEGLQLREPEEIEAEPYSDDT